MKRKAPSLPSLKESLAGFRDRIDRLDTRILGLLSERARVVEQVGLRKREYGAGIHDPAREGTILERLRKGNPGPLSDEAIERVFKSVISECRAYERDAAPILKGGGEPVTVSVIGLGLIGESIAKALRRHAPEVRVTGFDRKSKASSSAHRKAGSLAEALKGDIVILAVPVGEILRILKAHARDFSPGTILLDVGSTKREICELARRSLPESVSFVGGHPLSGRSVAGAGMPDPELFRGRPFILCPGGKATQSRAALAAVQALVEQIGALPVVMDPELHDRVLAVTSHLPQMASTALSAAAAKALRGLPLVYGPAFLQMTRFATSDYGMWHDIAESNRANLLRAIAQYSATLREIEKAVRSGKFEVLFRSAAKFRKSLGELK